jgi:CheY-like chemotaxis protein
MSPETVRTETIIHEAAEIFGRTLGAGLKISLQQEPNLPPIHIDVGLLKNALLNLLINARDSMPSGGVVTISVSVDDSIVLPNLANDARAAEAVRISVSDHGEGMTDTALARCIEPFFSTKRAGSGLGLSMVHGFAVQSGGKFEIESEVDQGTTATIYLPSVSSKSGHGDMGPDPDTFDLSGRRIFVVEDDPAVSSLLRRLLEGVGATVETAVTGDDACSKRDHWSEFDALVSDVVMPGSIQGDTLAMLFADAHPHKPIVLFTGNPEMVRETLRPSEKFELLAIPVERAVFLSAVSRLLRAPPE